MSADMPIRNAVPIFFFALLTQLCISAGLRAQEPVCAEVRIEIPQVVSLERQAFDAKLAIKNGVGAPITQLNVEVEFKDAAGNSVIASSDPNSTTAVFFIRVSELVNVTGEINGNATVAAQTNAEINWLIVPTAGAGGPGPVGLTYFVGANISYRQNEELRSVTVLPDSILVEPQPALVIDYFLQRDVYGDEPFTPEIEPPEPFTLGVRIKNTGGGIARNLRIDTAQPQITENAQGLPISFRIVSSFVGANSISPSLLLDFGSISAQAAVVGRWQMTATFSGRFADFDADYAHDDSTGGALTSLIAAVNARDLVKDVRVDLPGRDAINDFLALDGDVLRTYESDNIDTVVVNRSGTATLVAGAASSYQLQMGGSSVLPSFAAVVDPTQGRMVIERVTRADGTELPLDNVWLSKTRVTGAVFNYKLNLYDARGAGSYTIFVTAQNQARISGLVYRDNNDDGQMNGLEPPLFNVPVRLTGTTVGNQPVELNQRTGADGTYLFDTLQAGRYAISIGDMPGLRNGIHRVGTAGGDILPDRIENITLPVNLAASGYQFAKVPLSSTTQADLAVAIEALTTSVGVGQEFDVRVELSNRGPDSGPAGVNLTLPSALTLVSGSPDVGQFDLAARTWRLNSLNVQSVANLQLRLRAGVSGSRVIVAEVSGASVLPDPIPSNNRAQVVISASTLTGDLIFEDGFELRTTPKQPVRHFGRTQAAAPASSNVDSASDLFDTGFETPWGGFENPADRKSERPEE